MARINVLAAAVLPIALSTVSFAALFPETEPNNTKAAANAVAFVAPGDAVTGLSTGTSTTATGLATADNFLISFPAQSAGIYRNRLTLTTNGTAGHAGTIRGLTQTAAGTNATGPGNINAGTDATVQTSSTLTTPVRFNQFYSFGAATSLNYRVTGATATTVGYVSTWSQEAVTPVSLGSFTEGSFTFTNFGLNSTLDTEVLVLNSSFGVIGSNDDVLDVANGGPALPTGSSGLNSFLPISLTPGTYYLAISNFNTSTSSASTANEGSADASVLDFAGAMVNSSTGVIAAIPFRIISPDGTLDFQATKPGGYDVYFASFTVNVIPEPSALGLLAPVALLAARRRRA